MKIVNLFVLLLFISASSQAQDWANLKRFQDENHKLAEEPASNKRVVFMGNSITEAWIRMHPDFFKKNDFVNRGISGQTTPQMLVRFRPDVINLKPKVVVILAGINDIAGNTGPSTLEMIEDNIASMAVLAKGAGIKVVLSSVLPANIFTWAPDKEPADKVITLNNWIKKYAKDNGHVYLDYYSPMVDDKKGLPKSLSGDGVHPNEEGYLIMEPLVLKAIGLARK